MVIYSEKNTSTFPHASSGVGIKLTEKMRNIAEKRKEQDLLLMKVMLEENDFDKELALIDYRFIKRCMNVMQVNTLCFNSRYRQNNRKNNVRDEILNFVELAINEMHKSGYMIGEEVCLKKEQIKEFLFDFTFKYKKAKGKVKKRIHLDTMKFSAKSKEDAELLLKNRLKKLKEELIEIVSCKHTVTHAITIENKLVNINLLRLLD